MTARRDILKLSLLLPLLANARRTSDFAGDAAAPWSPFDFAVLKGMARSLSSLPPAPASAHDATQLARLDYDRYQRLQFRHEKALWYDEQRGFRVEFFHVGRGFMEPVRMFEVENGRARELLYRPELFDLASAGIEPASVPRSLGFAGFRVQAASSWHTDVTSFLGASYFRAVGSDTRQFGLSARGLALNSGRDPEEFPRFTSFWLERPAQDARTFVVYALLDSRSTTGAYRLEITPGASQIMDVDVALYPRAALDSLGVAPLTSMYLTGENDRRQATDWRPEIHDSDGLSIRTSDGEWIWRPLSNPPSPRINAFLDKRPSGFGLLQRDRDFDHYQDDGVFYHRRPSLWVEPKGDWGPGAVELVELPTPDELNDNVVAYWTPAEKPAPGSELLLSYRLYWGTHLPSTPPLAHTVATRTGIGGVVGQVRRRFSWRFAIDFSGGELATLAADANVEPVISATRGCVQLASARPLRSIDGYRAMFDVEPNDEDPEPINLRLFLRLNGQPLTETWLYQWLPPSPEYRLSFSGTGPAQSGLPGNSPRQQPLDACERLAGE